MISEKTLEITLARERTYWRRRKASEYTEGILYGLQIASNLLSKMPKHKVESWMLRQNRVPLEEKKRTGT